MTTYHCAACGQESSDADFCSECGAAINATPVAASSAPQASVAATGQIECPNCKTLNEADSEFCLSCGYDFKDGTLPGLEAGDIETAAPLTAPDSPPVVLTVEPTKSVVSPLVLKVHYDLARQPITENPTLPSGSDERTFSTTDAEFTIGRRKNNGRPNIELNEDIGVSRDHGKFVYFGGVWNYVDHSTNGTKINGIDALPNQMVALGIKDLIKVGDWTEIEILQV